MQPEGGAMRPCRRTGDTRERKQPCTRTGKSMARERDFQVLLEGSKPQQHKASRFRTGLIADNERVIN